MTTSSCECLVGGRGFLDDLKLICLSVSRSCSEDDDTVALSVLKTVQRTILLLICQCSAALSVNTKCTEDDDTCLLRILLTCQWVRTVQRTMTQLP